MKFFPWDKWKRYRFVLLSFFHLLNFIFTFFSTFVMDAFKRVYSNEDTATKAIPYFWENFDAENYSIWFCEYKYPEELTLTFMSCNLISGTTYLIFSSIPDGLKLWLISCFQVCFKDWKNWRRMLSHPCAFLGPTIIQQFLAYGFGVAMN